MKNSNVLCFGELLVDMISINTGNIVNSKGFLKKFGGAPANTAVGLAKLGIQVSFMGKIGDDPFGHFLKNELEKYKVNTKLLILSEQFNTSLAFVSLKDNGERDFYFFSGAHETIKTDEVLLPKDVSVLHFGSLTQTNGESNRATMKLVNSAKIQHTVISYDPNIRKNLWKDSEKAQEIILKTASYVDILKLNKEEALCLSGEKDIEKAAVKLSRNNLDALFITLAENGCFYKTKNNKGFIKTISVKAIDTTGAGDAFNAGYIYARLSSGKMFSSMKKKEIEMHLKRALVTASLTTTKKGALTAFPTIEEIDRDL